MARGLSIEIDGRQVQSLAAAFGATEAQVEAAMRSTYTKMAKWLRTRAVRGLSAKLAIPQKILRARIRAYRLQGGTRAAGDGAKVWFGLRPIPFSMLKPRATADGVRAAGGRFEKGAFIGTLRGREQVLKREGAGRLPIRIVYADVEDPANIYVEDELIGSAEFDMQFFKLLEHELKWRTQILR